MADNYTHQYNAVNAMKIAGYTPRNYNAFITGANGPDVFFCYQMYNPFRKHNLSELGTLMHNHKTGQFLQNLFRLAQTDAQKDYCLGFLCHYALDSTIHPYVNYVTQAYGSPYNIPSGHGYFESALDSRISKKSGDGIIPPVKKYFPESEKLYTSQIITLLKKAVDATYPDHVYPRSEYTQAFKDFRFIKKLFCSPTKAMFPVMHLAEKMLGFSEGFILSHMQPCTRDLPPFPFWQDMGTGLYCVETLDEILQRADYLAAANITSGIEYFKGIYTAADLLENIGNKSYETGLTIDK